MNAVRTKHADWEDKTSIDGRPATEFAATVSGERSAITPRDLEDLFGTDGDEDNADLEATRMRDVPSSLLKAAAASEEAPPATVPRPGLVPSAALAMPSVSVEPNPPAQVAPAFPPVLAPVAARVTPFWRSPEAAIAATFFILAAAVTALIVVYSRG